MERVPTGIKLLDEYINGGIPRGFNILVTGEPGAGKSAIVHVTIYNLLKRGFYCIFISTDREIDDFFEETSTYGYDFEEYWKKGKFIFIDGHSWKSSVSVGGRNHKKVKYCVSLNRLTSLSVTLEEIRKKLEGERVVEVFDIFSELFLWLDEDEPILQFASTFCSRVRKRKNISLIVIEEGMQPPQMIKSLQAITQGTIHMGVENGKRYLEVVKMQATEYEPKKIYFDLKKRKGKLEFLNV